MTKNTAYYKAAFAKSEAASPYAKMNPHMKKDKTHMMAHHGDTSMKMGHESHMAKHPGHMKMDDPAMKMGHRKEGMKKSPPDPGTGLTKKYGTHAKMAGKTHMKGTMEEHRAHHAAEHKNKEKKSDGGKFLEGLQHPRIPGAK